MDCAEFLKLIQDHGGQLVVDLMNAGKWRAAMDLSYRLMNLADDLEDIVKSTDSNASAAAA